MLWLNNGELSNVGRFHDRRSKEWWFFALIVLAQWKCMFTKDIYEESVHEFVDYLSKDGPTPGKITYNWSGNYEQNGPK